MAKTKSVSVETTTSDNHPTKQYQVKKMKIKDLKFQSKEDNPNEMSLEEEQSLRNSYDTFGDLQPIIIDQNNLIVHGNHRTKVLQEMGAKYVNCYQVEFEDDEERFLLAQTMNKLHGHYDKIRDAEQMTKLFESNKLEKLSHLIAKPENHLLEFITVFAKRKKELAEQNLDIRHKNINIVEDPSLTLRFAMKSQEDYTEVITKLRYFDTESKENALLKLVRTIKEK